jgi:hypothetical protein
VPIRGVQFFLDTRNNGALPMDVACHECLSVIIITQLQLNLQLRNN